jgi:hypothetical protein
MPEETVQNTTAADASDKKFSKPTVRMEWVGPARVHFDRDHNFFVTLFVIAVAVSFVLVLFRQYSLMLVVMALAFTIYATNKHAPKQVRYQILNNSVKIDDDQYYYDEMYSFWFEEIGGEMVVRFSLPFGRLSRVEMVIEPGSREAIEDLLLENLPYEEIKTNRIIRYLEHLVLPIHPKREATPEEN